MAIAQVQRILYIKAPSGLLLQSFSGTEAMSRLFSYQLLMVSETDLIQAKDIVGKNISWRVQYKDSKPRFFNGFVSRFAAGDISPRNWRSYRAEVVPWLWFLTRTANCRIFPPNKTAPEIIQMVFADLGFSSLCDSELKKTYRKREYCVQYRETAFNFVSRLMEEEGIFYFFRHEDGQHKLVLADQKTSYKDVPNKQVEVESWDHQFEFLPGTWARTDYNFETPSTNLFTNTDTVIDLQDVKKYEMFDYPGDYPVKGDGTNLTKVRMEEEEAAYEVGTGTSEYTQLTPGGKFTLKHDAKPESGKGYVITSVQHSGADADFDTGEGEPDYSNSFHCIPDGITYRPQRLTPKPLIAGPQTAVVVGPKGEEIYTDKYGRVKVQFFWDREGKKDENSSCWMRVSQNWAGKNWGIIFNPRIGQEVVVEFLEGDPDRPLITGRVYNAEQMPPYELPANQTQSVIKTRSSKGGTTDNFNELRFEDKKDKEEIYFHAERDFNRVVENNDTLKVGSPQAPDGSQTIEIYKDRTETVKTGNEKVTVEKGNRNVEISMGNEALNIKMGNQTTKLDLGASSTEAMQSIELKVGQSSIKLDQTGVTIKGLLISVQGQIQTELKGLMTTVGADAILQVKGALTMIG